MASLATQLGILIKILYDGKGAKAAVKDMKGLEKVSYKSGQTLKGMGAIVGTVGVGLAAAAAAAYGAKKAFEFSREGAALNQLEESFDRMNASVFKTPDLLDRMSEAAKGTVKESEMMAGLLTLTAGATDELARAQAEAAPKLMEIAKAANKLNPTLGDTGFLYESMARGIKRSSPLILDNTGLVIKIGEANEKWAEKMGMTVEAMSAQDKQFALLEAALTAGDKLIQQVGGSVDSQTDSYDKLTTAFGNFMDQVKQDIATQDKLVAFLADSLDLSLEARDAFDVLSRAYDRGAISARKLDTEYKIFVRDNKLFLEQNKDLIASLLQSEKELEANANAANTARTRYRRLRTDGVEPLTDSEEDLADALKESGVRAYEATEALTARQAMMKEASDHINDILIKAEEEAADATRKLREEMTAFALSLSSGDATLGLFNEELGQLGPQLITIGGRTADQNRLLSIATDEYDALGQKISDMSAAPVLFGKSVDEASEAIEGMIERQGELMPIMDEFGSITSTAAMVIQEATWNEDALTTALFNQAGALMKNKEDILNLAVSMGQLNEEQAEAILKAHVMYNEHLPKLSSALAHGVLDAGSATKAMMGLASGFYETAEGAIAAETEIDDAREALEKIEGNWEALFVARVQRGELDRLLEDLAKAQGGLHKEAQEHIEELLEDTSNGGGTSSPPPPPRPPGPELAQGGSFTVPPGYPNDSFPMRVQSGEHVTVTPSGGGRRGGGSQRVTVNQYFLIQGGGNPAFIGQEAAGRVANTLGNSMRG